MFAKKNSKKEVVKVDGAHVYEKDVEFKSYYSLYLKERNKYPIIMKNVIDFEIQFKSIIAYHILTSSKISNSIDLEKFLEGLKLKLSCLCLKYNDKRINHMNKQIDDLKSDIFKYADIYCFFDRMTLGSLLTLFTCLEDDIQNCIFSDLKRYNLHFDVDQVPDFISKIFCLISIRNCVMHSNSLEILTVFYDAKKHSLRKFWDKKKYLRMIKVLSKEKTHN